MKRLPVNLSGHRLDSSAHICAFFDSDEEHYEAITPYFSEALAHGELLVNIYEKQDHNIHLGRLREGGVAVDAALASKQMELFTPEETYLAGGAFDVHGMLDRVKSLLEQARASRFGFLRTCADMGWALRAMDSTDALMEYEARLGFLTRQHQCTLMCAYDTRKFSRATFKDILRTHPQVLIGSTIVENPYYVTPMEYLRELIAKGGKRALARPEPLHGVLAPH